MSALQGTRLGEPAVAWPTDPEKWYIRVNYAEWFLGPYDDDDAVRRALIRIDERDTHWRADNPVMYRGNPDAASVEALEWRKLPGIGGDPKRLYHVTKDSGAPRLDLKLRVSAHYVHAQRGMLLSVDIRDDAPAAIADPQHTWKEAVAIAPDAEPLTPEQARLRLRELVRMLMDDFTTRVTDSDLRVLGWLPKG